MRVSGSSSRAFRKALFEVEPVLQSFVAAVDAAVEAARPHPGGVTDQNESLQPMAWSHCTYTPAFGLPTKNS